MYEYRLQFLHQVHNASGELSKVQKESGRLSFFGVYKETSEMDQDNAIANLEKASRLIDEVRSSFDFGYENDEAETCVEEAQEALSKALQLLDSNY